MEGNWPTQTFILSLTSILLGVASFLVFCINEPENNLLFGVISAQGNFEARQVIRDTWKKQANNIGLPVLFVVGERFCDIPLLDRVCQYSCHRLQRTSLKNLPKDLTTSVIAGYKQSHKNMYAGFTFKVNNKIVVDKLRIINKVMAKLKLVKVHLIDAISKEKLASVTFVPSEEGNSESILSKSIEPYLLPKNFEGILLMETMEKHLPECCSEMEWTNGNGAISFVQLISPSEQLPIYFHSDSCSPVSMSFHLYDLNEFEHQIETELSRTIEWKEEINLLQDKLLQESLDHNDILFVDVVDLYRNLPKKLLLFLKWIHKNKNFRHVVKSDDDSLLDVNEIKKGLAFADPEVPSIWAELRTNWAVSTTGKWREDRFLSLVYPPFPCGAGYALSRALVRYLSSNSELLETGFQGEDVSVGIWLSGLAVGKVRSELRWSCDAGCDRGTLSLAQNTAAEMRLAWASWSRCRSFCGCDNSTPVL